MGRQFTSLQLRGNFVWHPDRIRSVANMLPNCASRWWLPERQEKFCSTCRDLGIVPHECGITDDMFATLPLHYSR